MWGISELREFKLLPNAKPSTSPTTKLTKVVPVDKKIFGEGAVDLHGLTYMLSYHSKKIFVYRQTDWVLEKTLPFVHGEGWGLSTDGCNLIATTGDSWVRILDPKDGKLLSKVQAKDGRSGKAVRV